MAASLIQLSPDGGVAAQVDGVAVGFRQLLFAEQVPGQTERRHLALRQDVRRDGVQVEAVFLQPQGLESWTFGQAGRQAGNLVLVQVKLRHGEAVDAVGNDRNLEFEASYGLF